jgi:hypothetical protein
LEEAEKDRKSLEGVVGTKENELTGLRQEVNRLNEMIKKHEEKEYPKLLECIQ